MGNIITKTSIENKSTIRNGKEVVRSDGLSKMFNRTHKQVLALIRINLDLFKENNLPTKDFFIEEKTKTVKGNEYVRYFLTRKGFDLIALSLRGEKAQAYKAWYINAFHSMDETLLENKITAKINKSSDLWIQFKNEEKVFKNKLAKAIHNAIVIYRNEVEKKMNDGKYYYHYTSLIYRILNIDVPKGVNPRDVLDKRMLARLEDKEDEVAERIEALANAGVYYKEAYKTIKKEMNDK